MEIIDIVNEKDQIIGEIDKSEVHRGNGPIHREVGIILIDSNNQILIQQHSLNKKTYPGLWVTSAGGHVKKGEEPYFAAQRELREELGLECELAYLTKNFDKEISENHMVYWYLGKYNNEKLSPDSNEVETVKLVSQTELEKLMQIDEIKPKLNETRGHRNNYSLKMFKMFSKVWNHEFDKTIKDQLENQDKWTEPVYYVNENDTVLGKIDKEIANFNPMYIHREVGIAIVDKDKKMLWQQRAKTKRVGPLKWTITTAGHVIFETTYNEAAHRELIEEAGFDTDLSEIYSEFHLSKNEKHIMKFYIGKYDDQKIIPQESEVAQYKFLSVGMVEKMRKDGEKIGRGSLECAKRIANGEFDQYLF